MGALALAASCGDEPLAPTQGDRIPEISISGANLLSEYTRDESWLVSPLLEAPDRATRVGFMIDMKLDRMDAPAAFEARGIDRYGRAGKWVAAEETWREAEIRVARADLGLAAVAAQIRIAESEAIDLSTVLWSAVVPVPSDDAPIATLRRPLAGSLAAAGVKSRADWGARPTNCSTQDPVKTRMAVHHTVTPPSASGGFEERIRGIQAYHMDSNGWCDIGYTFMVTVDGQGWEAREAIYLGAHVANNNSNNIGVSFVGCFHPGDATCDQGEFQPSTPPEAMIQGGGNLIGLLKNEFGVTVNDSTVLGHRDHAGAQTSCPGNALYSEIGRMRDIANGVNPGPVVGNANGVVWDLAVTPGPNDAGNVRIVGATITCSCGRQTTARDGDAFWTFDLEPGVYTFTAEAPGYAPATRDLMVTGGSDVWGSIGLSPAQTSFSVGVHVTDGDTGEALEGAEVALGNVGVALTDAAGNVAFTTSPGSGPLSVRKEGFVSQQNEVTFSAATTFEVKLVKIGVGIPGDPIDDTPPVEAVTGEDPKQVPGEDPKVEDSGCGCNATGSNSGSTMLALLLAGGVLLRVLSQSRARVRARHFEGDRTVR